MDRYPVMEDVTAGSEEKSERPSIEVIRSIYELEHFRRTWVSWQHHPNSDMDFYLTVLGTRPEILRPHVMVVHRGGSPEAMLVGRLELRRLEAKVGYASLLAKKTRTLTFLYGGLLGNLSAEGSDALVLDIMKSLSDGEADLAYFNHLKEDSPLYRAAVKLPGRLSRDYIPDHQFHHAITVPGSLEEFYCGLSSKWRKTLKWDARRLVNTNSGDVSVRCFREIEDLDRLIEDVEGITKKTYQRGLGVGFSNTPEIRRRLSLEAAKGSLRGYVLYVRGCPWAFFLGSLYRGTFHGDFMGYDPLHAKYSPGMFLVVKMIEDLCNGKDRGERISMIDFGLGDAQYKRVLSDLRWNDSSLYIFSPRISGVSLNLMRTAAAMLDRAARGVLGKAGLLDRVKKMWRLKLNEKQAAGAGQ